MGEMADQQIEDGMSEPCDYCGAWYPKACEPDCERNGMAKVLVEQNPKRGPKPRYGKNRTCLNKSVSMPDFLWRWCEEQALFDDRSSGSTSAYIVSLIERERKRLK